MNKKNGKIPDFHGTVFEHASLSVLIIYKKCAIINKYMCFEIRETRNFLIRKTT